MIDLLESVGNDSTVDGLRFSYEVSQVEDNDSQQFSSYASCIELDARQNPFDTCFEIVNRVPSQFALFSDDMKQEVCMGIANDVNSDESQEGTDLCGFITVSAFQVYNEFYRGLSEQLGEWMYDKMQKDLEKIEQSYSKTASGVVGKMSKTDWSNLIDDKVEEEFEEPEKADLQPEEHELPVESEADQEK